MNNYYDKEKTMIYFKKVEKNIFKRLYNFIFRRNKWEKLGIGKIDYSKYEKQIKPIKKLSKSITKDKKLMKQLEKFKKSKVVSNE